ncbi:hypothetical protein, partial [Aeromonas taiwanensis]|uniref:hypothetical protein n=1 Tax=Aeromonas taiwanensis TaxID=633417 RepID=UPI003B9F8FB3
MEIPPQQARLSADNGVSAPEHPLARTATGIVKWNTDPGRPQLSADNRGDLRQTPAGPNCYRYREMEYATDPGRPQLSADNGVSAPENPLVGTATGIVKWKSRPNKLDCRLT